MIHLSDSIRQAIVSYAMEPQVLLDPSVAVAYDLCPRLFPTVSWSVYETWRTLHPDWYIPWNWVHKNPDERILQREWNEANVSYMDLMNHPSEWAANLVLLQFKQAPSLAIFLAGCQDELFDRTHPTLLTYLLEHFPTDMELPWMARLFMTHPHPCVTDFWMERLALLVQPAMKYAHHLFCQRDDDLIVEWMLSNEHFRTRFNPLEGFFHPSPKMHFLLLLRYKSYTQRDHILFELMQKSSNEWVLDEVFKRQDDVLGSAICMNAHDAAVDRLLAPRSSMRFNLPSLMLNRNQRVVQYIVDRANAILPHQFCLQEFLQNPTAHPYLMHHFEWFSTSTLLQEWLFHAPSDFVMMPSYDFYVHFMSLASFDLRCRYRYRVIPSDAPWHIWF